MRNAINNQIEVIEDIKAAITVARTAEESIILRKAKNEATITLTTLRQINNA